MILEEIHKVMAEHHERTGKASSVRQFHDGVGRVTINGMIVDRWDELSEAEEVIRKALAPPPPTKKLVLEMVRRMEVSGETTAYRLDILRRFIEATGADADAQD